MGLYRPTRGTIEFDGRRDRPDQVAQGAPALQPADADDLPGPLRQPQPALAGGGHHRRADPEFRDPAGTRGRRGAGGRIASAGRAKPGGRGQLSPSVLRRSAPADRHCTGSRWFERLLAELGFELWIGHPAEIKAKRVKKQKTDRKDAELLLRLMRENNFPQIWVPSPENRDLRQLLWHRHRMVQMRTRIMNQLACVGDERGLSLEEKTIQRTRASTVGEARVSSLGQSTPARVVGTCSTA